MEGERYRQRDKVGCRQKPFLERFSTSTISPPVQECPKGLKTPWPNCKTDSCFLLLTPRSPDFLQGNKKNIGKFLSYQQGQSKLLYIQHYFIVSSTHSPCPPPLPHSVPLTQTGAVMVQMQKRPSIECCIYCL